MRAAFPCCSAADSAAEPAADACFKFLAGGARVARLSLSRQPTGKTGEAKMTESSLALFAGDP
jgi:hypothetical protein